jgi:transposase
VTSHPTIPTLRVVPSSTRHNSTTITAIQEAIEYIESREAGDKFSYRQVAKIFGVDRTTLSRRHKGLQVSHEAKIANQQRLNPQQEDEVVSYIERATRDGLPPTRGILKNFGSAVAQQEVSDSWVDRFRHRHPDELTTKWDTGIDRGASPG